MRVNGNCNGYVSNYHLHRICMQGEKGLPMLDYGVIEVTRGLVNKCQHISQQ